MLAESHFYFNKAADVLGLRDNTSRRSFRSERVIIFPRP